MPIPQKIIKFLEKSEIKYEPIKHRTVYTAQDKAATLKVKPKIVGKTLVVKLDKNPALVLIPANKNLDKEKLLKVANKCRNSHGRIRIAEARRAKARYSHADFAKESWMKKKLKGIKIGATPPFGIIWKLPTFIDASLIKEPKIVINSGDYNWSFKIRGSFLKKIIPDLAVGNFAKIKK